MKKGIFITFLSIIVLLTAGCSATNADNPAHIAETDAAGDNQTQIVNHSPYIRQNWALNLNASEIERIELVTRDESAPFALLNGEEMLPYIEMLNNVDGEFVAEPVVQGRNSEIYRSTFYVFMKDETRHTVTKAAGVDANYIVIDDSAFVCDNELFETFPESGTDIFPYRYVVARKDPEAIPTDQISRPRHIGTDAEKPWSTPEGFETYDWLTNLRAEDVEYIEFVCLDEPEFPYHRYEGNEIQKVVDLFHENTCYEYSPSPSWPGYFSKEFHVIMKDGTVHKVSSIYSVTTVIDGAAYSVYSEWLFDWPESGDQPLPENWFKTVASRNYEIVESEKSILTSASYEAEMDALNHQYNTDLIMGALSRNYKIGRGSVELSAVQANQEGVSLNAVWSGAPGIDCIIVEPQYWLERWQGDLQDGATGYTYLPEDYMIETSENKITGTDPLRWNVNWSNLYGSLEPGHYRIGMTLREEQDGNGLNNVVCYAKFIVE